VIKKLIYIGILELPKCTYLVQTLLRLCLGRTTGFWHSLDQAGVINLADLFWSLFARFLYLINIGDSK
jgi:hypothetical protein